MCIYVREISLLAVDNACIRTIDNKSTELMRRRREDRENDFFLIAYLVSDRTSDA